MKLVEHNTGDLCGPTVVLQDEYAIIISGIMRQWYCERVVLWCCGIMRQVMGLWTRNSRISVIADD